MQKHYKKKKYYKKKPVHILAWILVPLVMLVTVMVLLSALFGTHIEQANESGQDKQRQTFLAEIGPAAKRIQAVYDVPASIIMAQAALESNFGTAELAAKHHNLFGVKASPGMKQVSLATEEFIDGEWITKKEPFREYENWTESLIDHAQLIRKGTTDNPNRYDQVNTTVSYEDAAAGLVSGGYATDPKYADKLISMIETYSLDTYDK